MSDNIVPFGQVDASAAEKNRQSIEEAGRAALKAGLLEQMDILRELVERGEIRSLAFVGFGPSGETRDYTYTSEGCYEQPCRTIGALDLVKFDFACNVRANADEHTD